MSTLRAYKAMAVVGGGAASLGTYHLEEYGGDAGAHRAAMSAAALWERVHGGRAWVEEWTDDDAARLEAAIGFRSA